MKMFCLELSTIRHCNFEKAQLINSIGIKFVFISPGTFKMGSPDEEYGRYNDETYHYVTLTKGFLMATTAVTQYQWERVIGNNPSKFMKKGKKYPVENVSWNDVQKFIKKLNKMEQTDSYCLPTEAEWEYACRAGSTSRYCFGSDEKMLDEYAWFRKNFDEMTYPVKQKKPNAWGLYDMHGNVWEWCEDWYGDYPNEHVTDPIGPNGGSNRVIRGGCWSFLTRNFRSANRGMSKPSNRNFKIGFRIIRRIDYGSSDLI